MLNSVRANTRFSSVPPSVNMPRSTFDRDSGVVTTFNAADLVPVYLDEVLPGDTFDVSTGAVLRMSTPIYPVMDDAIFDLWFFYVPSRLLYDDFVHMMGEPKGAWYDQDQVYEVPQVKIDNPKVGGLCDYFGLPVGELKDGFLRVNAMPFRAYRLIYNEYFRDQNLTDPVLVNVGATLDDTSITDDLFRVSKYHDYFTSALPAPQRGPAVEIPFSGEVQVYGSPVDNSMIGAALRWRTTGGSTPDDSWIGVSDGVTAIPVSTDGSVINDPGSYLAPSNLVGSAEDLVVTINTLRQAIMIQRMYEADARGGARYRELMLNHFGVVIPDATVQIPELLSQQSMRIRKNQVVQTSSTDETSPLGNVAAVSKSSMQGHSFTKSFTEHGYLIGVCCVRTVHSYSQGIERLWTRRGRFDFYWPALAHLGEQPILNQEIYYEAGEDGNDEVFGYGEAWAEYRYKQNRLTAFMRPGVEGSLSAWNYGDHYESTPYLSTEWMNETPVNIDRTLAVSSDVAHQFILDLQVNNKTTRVMPLYSVPGLSAHL